MITMTTAAENWVNAEVTIEVEEDGGRFTMNGDQFSLSEVRREDDGRFRFEFCDLLDAQGEKMVTLCSDLTDGHGAWETLGSEFHRSHQDPYLCAAKYLAMVW